jgi:glycosidase
MIKKRIILITLLVALTNLAMAQAIKKIERMDPPNWWVGFQETKLQIMVYGKNIAETEVSFKYNGVKLLKINKVENPNYLFIDIEIAKNAKAGKIEFMFTPPGKKSFTHAYELQERIIKENQHAGFSSSDVMYLLMPDRFANGNPNNDNVDSLLEKANRNNPDGRHGGDLQGIINHLDYFAYMGFTALWLNPVLENNNPAYSYHGYAATDLYKVDARFGTNEQYLELIEKSHQKGMKIIMDMVFNHISTYGFLIKDIPMKDWIHQFENFTRSNYRASVISDPYHAEFDKEIMEKGWFDKHMADLNQDNPFVENYLTQNSIWWIEYASLDGIRMDTHPYPEKNMMSRWAERLYREYPKFNIVGEAWMQKVATTAYWQKGTLNKDGFNSNVRSVTDFPMQGALIKAFNENEGWTEGMSRLYYILAQDFLYANPNELFTFLDNHDLDRFFSSINYNLSSFKMALGFMLTTRGIPQIYYGTEILMDGIGGEGHGTIRKDFPGGWSDDQINAFTQNGLTNEQIEAQDYTKKILNWRKNNALIHSGELTHFLPENGIYVSFRHTENAAVMIVLNNKYDQSFETKRFAEILKKYSNGYDIIYEQELKSLEKINMPAKSIRIIELKK